MIPRPSLRRPRRIVPRPTVRLWVLVIVAAMPLSGVAAGITVAAAPLHVVADGVKDPLEGEQGSAARGRALVVGRNPANCVLCHAIPDSMIRFSGDLGPSLAGTGKRLDAAQLRLRVADNQRLNPATIMPSYYRVDGLVNVAAQYRDKPVLSAREVEDIVAYLSTLQ